MGFSNINLMFWGIFTPVGFVFLLFIYRRVKSVTTTWFDPSQYKFSKPLLKLGLRMGALLFATLALLGPYWGKSAQSVSEMGREVYVLLDVSASMNCDDIKPTRLDKAKKEAQMLIEKLKGDHVGLIVFSSHPFVQCPLTKDYKGLSMFLNLAESAQFAETGTDVRTAMYLAMERFLNTEKRSERVSRAIVLITDGEDYGESYNSILDRLQKNGIIVFPVGIGTYEGAAVPDLVNGKMRGHKRQKDGSSVISGLKDEGLKAIAERFDVPYYMLDGASKSLKGLVNDIHTLSASPLATRQDKVANSKFYFFAFLSCVFLGVSMFLMPVEKNAIQ